MYDHADRHSSVHCWARVVDRVLGELPTAQVDINASHRALSVRRGRRSFFTSSSEAALSPIDPIPPDNDENSVMARE